MTVSNSTFSEDVKIKPNSKIDQLIAKRLDAAKKKDEADDEEKDAERLLAQALLEEAGVSLQFEKEVLQRIVCGDVVIDEIQTELSIEIVRDGRQWSISVDYHGNLRCYSIRVVVLGAGIVVDHNENTNVANGPRYFRVTNAKAN